MNFFINNNNLKKNIFYIITTLSLLSLFSITGVEVVG